MNNSVIITLDQGSSSSRALAIDSTGRVVAQAARALQTIRPAEGLAEIDASSLLEDQLAVLLEVCAQIANRRVAALSVATQRSTIVFWDRITGQPLGPALSWQDGRAASLMPQITLSQETVHQLTGLYKTPFYSAAKITWALQHIPAVSEAAQAGRLCIGPVASYLIWHLTGGKVFACDPTLAQRTLLFNMNTLTWDDQLLNAFSVPKNCLPQIKKTADDYGEWTYQGTAIPIRVCVGDQQAALVALQVKEGDSCINYGTGAFFMHNTGSKLHLLAGLLTSVAATESSTGVCEYLLEGPVNACGTLLDWLQKIGFKFSIKELDDLCQRAQAPIDFLPALGGLGAPYWKFDSSVVMAGFSPQTTRADVAAGAVRSLAYLLADIVFYVAKSGVKSANIKVTGGLSQSLSLLTTQADILQMPLIPCAETEGTALGAAMLAAKETAWDISSWQTNRLLPAITPQIDATTAQKYYQHWQAFLQWSLQYPKA